MRTVVHDFDEILRKPLVVPSNTRYERARIRLAPDFDPHIPGLPSFWGAVRCLPDTSNVELEGLDLEGLEDAEWLASKAAGRYVWPVRGVALHQTRGVTLSHCRIARFPAEGIFTEDVNRLTVLDGEVSECWAGLAIDWPRLRPNMNVVVDGFRVFDTRALDASMMPIGSSVLTPGRLVGASGIHAMGLRAATFRRVHVFGENKGGLKVTNSVFVQIVQCRLPSLWLGGFDPPPVPGWGEQWRGPTSSAGTLVRDCVLGESAFGVAREKSSDGSALHCSYKTEDETRLERTTILAPRPGSLYAPWWGDKPAPGFDRFETIQVNLGYRLVTNGLRVIDLHPEASAPALRSDAASSLRHETEPVIDRVPQRWTAP